MNPANRSSSTCPILRNDMFRTPAAEALEWVADQCDQIKNQLPFRYSDEASNWGRVNGPPLML